MATRGLYPIETNAPSLRIDTIGFECDGGAGNPTGTNDEGKLLTSATRTGTGIIRLLLNTKFSQVRPQVTVEGGAVDISAKVKAIGTTGTPATHYIDIWTIDEDAGGIAAAADVACYVHVLVVTVP